MENGKRKRVFHPQESSDETDDKLSNKLARHPKEDSKASDRIDDNDKPFKMLVLLTVRV